MKIKNRSNFPDDEVEFLDDAEVKTIGTVGSTALVIVGRERVSGAAIVAKSRSGNPANEELFAMPLYELIAHSFDPIEITDEAVKAS